MNKKGFALAIVIMITLILMVMLFGVMAMAQNSILLVGNFQHKAAALYAAEAGVMRAIYELEGNPYYDNSSSIPIEEMLRSSTGKYKVSITNPNSAAVVGPYQRVTILSTGIAGPFRRSLKVEVRRSSGSYNALSNEGPILLDRDVYVNGISSITNPTMDTGNMHTNYDGTVAIDATGGSSVDLTGLASAMGGITDKIDPFHIDPTKHMITIQDLDKATLLANAFPMTTIPETGIISQNTVIDKNMIVAGLITLENGAILHVEGDMELSNGVVGKGSIIVDGKCVIKGAANVESNNLDGVVIFSEGDMYLCSPTSAPDSSGEMAYTGDDPVAGFFAEMPYDAPIHITYNLPVTAPRGIGFFRWYQENMESNDPDFLVWKDGDPDNPVLKPGLPKKIKKWLDKTPGVVTYLEDWYSGSPVE